ncbi:hypothetical protein DYBT9275_03570 [Dyadobacter sp. CECT 9275]|uniref:MFS transporter n=1 Tax=Dyadobacter helix TaxID=2822344 RepID=A0A916JGG0_9BACT|nr:DUF5690 family protein [Dyadobacter sp. CECT 9275]CAG5005376.1 hypothetical protein DYBT9275_03570 [Dyadobacter sp. CECT 9275]
MILRIREALSRSNSLFILWAVVASFGSYFCMYAFRKPFSAGLYQGLEIWGVSYKAVLIISQVAGYTISKFTGIKVISELNPKDRIKLIIGLILIAEAALFLFGIVPHPYNFVFLFVNGLPLGMVYGVVFSFLEGRRLTEMIAMGLSISVVVASGILKTTYIELHLLLPGISEFWMPFFMGALFLPLFLFFVWMLALIPAPSQDDIAHRTERLPMTAQDKRNVMFQFGFPILCLVVCYAILVVIRDFRDNFMIEIWNEIDANWSSSVLSQTEMISGIVVLVVIGSIAFVKSNLIGFRLTNLILLGGMLLSGLATYLFQQEIITGFYWMLLIGVGFFLSYTAIQTVIFERMIALFRMKANAGFFVYICESIGYMGSAGLLLYKEFFMKDLSWSNVLMQFSYLQAITGLVLLVLANLYLEFYHNSAARQKKKWPLPSL